MNGHAIISALARRPVTPPDPEELREKLIQELEDEWFQAVEESRVNLKKTLVPSWCMVTIKPETLEAVHALIEDHPELFVKAIEKIVDNREAE